MTEADLCRHLDAQTTLGKAIIDWRALKAGHGAEAIATAVAAGARILALDLFDEETLARVGSLLSQCTRSRPVFAAGSQGIEYALVAHWQDTGALPKSPQPPALLPAGPVLVVSGSCSEISGRQIAAAEAAGFAMVPINAGMACDAAEWDSEIEQATSQVLQGLAAGRNVLAATARGPADPAIAAFNARMAQTGAAAGLVHARIGDGLGRIARQARLERNIPRVVFSGGDTSGHAMLSIGVEALEAVASLANGVPLMRARAQDPRFDGLEVALKGGQMGDDALFIRACRGDNA